MTHWSDKAVWIIAICWALWVTYNNRDEKPPLINKSQMVRFVYR